VFHYRLTIHGSKQYKESHEGNKDNPTLLEKIERKWELELAICAINAVLMTIVEMIVMGS